MPSSLIEKTEVHLNNCELEILVNSSMPSSLKETVFAPPSSRKTLDKRDVLSLPSKSYSQNVSKLSSAESISMVSLDLALSSGVCNMSVNAALDKNSNIQQHAKLSGVESQRVHFKICGLINLGNTCYMNSALQCLVHTEPLRELIEPTDKNESRTLHTSQPSDRRPLASSFSHLIKDMLQAPSLGYCDPCALKKAIESHAPIFKGNSQQDAQELITFFIGGLHEEFNEITGKKPYVTMEVDESQFESEEEIADEWRKLSEKRDKSEIIKIFYGRTKCTMKCQNPSCGHELRMYEPVFPLTLPIPQKSDVSLKDCLKFYTEEKISTDPWYCEECNEEVTFSRKVEMWNMPQILMVYLKRFSFKRGIYTKIYNHVKFDLLFPLKDICPREKEKYQLYAVINHSGSLQSGHYYAFVKCQDKWHECNDFICNEISEDDVITSSAYVLFYERVKVKESEE